MRAPLERFAAAAEGPALRLGPSRLRTLAARIAGQRTYGLRDAVPGFTADVDALLAASDQEDLEPQAVAAYLLGVAAALAHQGAAVRVESVWSGPTSHAVPVRATVRALTELVDRARRELLLMTYSAKPYPPLRQALAAATGRGVTVRAVVETLQGAGSALSGDEPAAAFQDTGTELWHWPVDRRAAAKDKMHAKIAVGDRRELLVSSANLTHSGIGGNLEAGLLVRGGSAPERAAEHFDALRAEGVLRRL
ncbi:DISARM system phospholipase D-like protein DrmC [Actinomadura parmotrematis]|uniref:phospholipase D n=1 Tax=Actinomadura parmotrematis TaxID=2864039 RepID=A0ABS7FZJ0_9ACTN|nr:DISARM system phospholipase D-like protein DrmC [Actinomadura parmotrematis]MBW8485560.1 DISARM system phospholipase D-like protein DrmC [Actinomadura parmotrematis]